MSSNPIILYVDDDPVALGLLTARLQADGLYDVVGCLAADKAFDLAMSCEPDCILLDWRMPAMSGLTLLQKLRREGRFQDTPIFMLTGRTKMADMEDALDKGANWYFTKPAKYDLIARRIEKYVDRRAP